jgi:hypothetical protein
MAFLRRTFLLGGQVDAMALFSIKFVMVYLTIPIVAKTIIDHENAALLPLK